MLSSTRRQSDPDRSLFQSGADPQEQPEVHLLREQILSWRFYDSFRTDAGAPSRQPRVGTRCFALAGDGGDLPAAVQTILENGDGDGLQQAIEDAFPGCHLSVSTGEVHTLERGAWRWPTFTAACGGPPPVPAAWQQLVAVEISAAVRRSSRRPDHVLAMEAPVTIRLPQLVPEGLFRHETASAG